MQDMAAEVPSTGPHSLVGMALMDKTASALGVVQTFDPKHNIKRFRERDKNEIGVKVRKNRASLNRHTLSRLALAVDPTISMKSLLDPDDK